MNTRMKKQNIPLLASAASLVLCAHAHAITYQTYVIATYGGDALLPVVRQQLNGSRDGGTVATYQGKLIMQTTAANYNAVQQLLAKVDTQPQAITVSVRVGNNSSRQNNIQQGRVIISNRGIQGAGVISQSSNQQQRNNLYQVQTLSGSAASISISTLRSLTQTYNATTYPSDNRPSAQITLQQQVLLPTTQGIQVTPRLLPNGQVEVQLAQIEEHFDRSNSPYQQNGNQKNTAIKRQALNSTLIVARGQWITVGQITQNSQNQSSNDSSRHTHSLPIQLLVQ